MPKLAISAPGSATHVAGGLVSRLTSGLGSGGFSRVELFTVVTVVVFGLFNVLMIPLGAGYDEETHLVRVWELSHFRFVPNEVIGPERPFPAIYWDLSYRRSPLVGPVSAGFWKEYGAKPIDAEGYIYSGLPTRSTYSPVTLLPQSLAMRYLGRKFQLSALQAFYGSRLAGLVTYALLVWLAVRFTPVGKWAIAIAATLPMALFQASTINADVVTNGIGLLFIAISLYLSTRDGLRWYEVMLLIASLILLFGVKPNTAVLALLILMIVPHARRRNTGKTMAVVVVALALFVVEVLGWNAIVVSRSRSGVEGADAGRQVEWIVRHLDLFAGVMFRDLLRNGGEYARGMLGEYGYGYWAPPAIVYLLSPIALLGVVFAETTGSPPPRRSRIVIAAVLALGYLATIGALYVTVSRIASPEVTGVQGRYLLPFVPLALIPFVGAGNAVTGRWATRAVVGTAWISLAAYSAGIYLSYHVTCGTQAYRTGLCYQPVYKNWAPDDSYSPPAPPEGLVQEVIPECNGMEEVRLWVNALGSNPEARTTFLLRDPSRDQDVVLQSTYNRDLPAGGWLTLGFPVEEDSAGHYYQLKVLGGESDESGSVRVALTLQPEYSLGKLYMGESEQRTDLVFQYGCRLGLEKVRRSLIERISR
ncbi:MAG: DUF2142 domain-containing protein [Anaerolineales bacterium]|nr:DUF2142 domain-containing protein [Anaerolineales bacterium]